MGIEYKLRFKVPDVEAVASVLERIPQSRRTSLVPHQFNLGEVIAENDWSQALVQVEQGGVYFCANCGGDGPEWLGIVLSRLVANFGEITVSEL